MIVAACIPLMCKDMYDRASLGYQNSREKMKKILLPFSLVYAPSYMGSSDTLAVGHFEPNPVVKLDNWSRGSTSTTWF